MGGRTMVWLVAQLLAFASLPVAVADNPSAAPPSAVIDAFIEETGAAADVLSADAETFVGAVIGNVIAAVATVQGGNPPDAEAQNIVTAASDPEVGFVPRAQAAATAYAMEVALPTALLLADHANDTAFAILVETDTVVDAAAAGGRLVVNQTVAVACSNPLDPAACEDESFAGIAAFQAQKTSMDALLFVEGVDTEALAAEARAALEDVVGPLP